MTTQSAATNLSDIQSDARKLQAQRLVYWFDVPEAIGGSLGVDKLGFVELLVSEEQSTTELAKGLTGTAAGMQIAYLLARESLRFVNDDAVLTGDGSSDTFWAASKPNMAKIRTLAVQAYQFIHSPEEEEAESFLGSMRVSARG